MPIDSSGKSSIRRATTEDIDGLAVIFAHTIKAQGPQYYSQQQVEAWAATTDDMSAFSAWILNPATFVAEYEKQLLGFCGIESDGHITSLYVDARWNRRGIGTRLLQAAIDFARQQGIVRLYAEANPFSQPLFKKLGFRQTGIEEVERRGARFMRNLVELHLPDSINDGYDASPKLSD